MTNKPNGRRPSPESTPAARFRCAQGSTGLRLAALAHLLATPVLWHEAWQPVRAFLVAERARLAGGTS